MTDTYNGSTGFTKTYTGTTTVAEGTLRFAAGQLGTGAVTVSKGGRLEVAPGTTLSNALTVNDGGELAITGSGTATFSGAVTLNKGGIVGLKFTDAGESPKFAFTSAPTLNGDVFVKIETASGILPRNRAGRWIVATGVGSEFDVGKLGFDNDIAPKPTWVEDSNPFSVEDGDLILNVKQPGLVFRIR